MYVRVEPPILIRFGLFNLPQDEGDHQDTSLY